MLTTTLEAPPRRIEAPRQFGPLPAAPRESGGWIRREEAIMGTAISAQLWADDVRTGTAAAAAVMGEMHRIDRRMSPHKPDSELSRINQGAGVRPVPCSEEMFRLLTSAQDFAARSQGAFDITYAAVGHLYDYRAGLRPDDEALEAAR